MSYNQQRAGYTPSYSSQNTGAAYMARRGWDRTDRTDDETISFHGTSNSKKVLIGLLILLTILLIIAVIFIILFATGVISSTDPVKLTPLPIISSSIAPPITLRPTPPLILRNTTFFCSLIILRQANSAYEMKTSSNFQSAFQMVREALNTVILQSALQLYNPVTILDDLRNRGDDLEVVFRVKLPSSSLIDYSYIGNILKTEKVRLETELGGNVSIDSNSIVITQSS